MSLDLKDAILVSRTMLLRSRERVRRGRRRHPILEVEGEVRLKRAHLERDQRQGLN